MGRIKMNSLKITFLPLAICLLLSLNSQVFGKPRPKHLLIETKEKAKKGSEDYANIRSNSGVVNDHSIGNFKDYEVPHYCFCTPCSRWSTPYPSHRTLYPCAWR